LIFNLKDGIHWDATAHRRITNLILNHICEAWGLTPPYRILENSAEQEFSNKIRRQITNPIPTQLKNQLNDLDLKRHLNYASKPTDSKKQGIISNSDLNNELPKHVKRKRSLSNDRTSTNNAPVPLMQINLQNTHQAKRLCIQPQQQQQQQQEIDFTQNQTDYYSFDFSSEPIVNGLNFNQFIQSLN
jgi:hypothetical protein